MDERLKTLKPGDCIRWRYKPGGESSGVFIGIDGPRLVVRCWDYSAIYPDQVIWPEAPKAKPGVVYRRIAPHYLDGRDYAIGTASGQLRREINPDRGEPFDIWPDWQEVPEP